MKKSELLRAIQTEIQRHGLDTFPVRVDNGNIVTPGCPACRKTLYTVSNFIDHINQDVLPPLLDRLSKTENAEPPDEDFIDVDYWAAPERKIRRKSGEQDAILTATGACSESRVAHVVGRPRHGGPARLETQKLASPALSGASNWLLSRLLTPPERPLATGVQQ